VSNALKHAFINRQHGTLLVSFRQEQDNYVLMVGDDGNGLPEDFDLESTKSLGMRVVAIKVRDLQGEIQLQQQAGTLWRVIFAKQP
jgi:two-component sensor histidine kinase